MHVYCVGGSVRDSLLGKPGTDTDYVVLGCTAHDFLRSFPKARKVGRNHPVFLLKGRQYTLSSAQSIDQDLKSRDLTINALALDQDGYLYAHPLALPDLAHKTLRPIAWTNFFADPLRAFRAARFKACLENFRASSELRNLIRQVSGFGLLNRVAAERVGREVRLACMGNRPGNFLRLLACTRCLQPWLAELANSDFKETARIMDILAGNEKQVWMALVHRMKTGVPDQISGPGPDTASGSLAADIGNRLRLPNQLIAAGRCAATWQQAACNYQSLDVSLRVRLLLDLHEHNALDDLTALAEARTGADLTHRVKADLRTVLEVRLPWSWRNKGRASGEYLHLLRCRALQK
ncbi:MAG: tRNA nucleotidyltransferase [Desulfovermiculus sp.]